MILCGSFIGECGESTLTFAAESVAESMAARRRVARSEVRGDADGLQARGENAAVVKEPPDDTEPRRSGSARQFCKM